MRHEGSGWDRSFFLVASQQRRFVAKATTRMYFFNHIVPVPFGEGTMRRTRERVGPLLFFWQFVNAIHGTRCPLEKVVLLGATPALSTHQSPF